MFPIQVGIQFPLEVNENKGVKFSKKKFQRTIPRRLEWTFHWWGTPQGNIAQHIPYTPIKTNSQKEKMQTFPT